MKRTPVLVHFRVSFTDLQAWSELKLYQRITEGKKD
jgi:hypothetical protein